VSQEPAEPRHSGGNEQHERVCVGDGHDACISYTWPKNRQSRTQKFGGTWSRPMFRYLQLCTFAELLRESLALPLMHVVLRRL
jgi:hypothetical protein